MTEDTPQNVSRRNFIKGVIAAGTVASSSAYLFRSTTLHGQPSAAGAVERLITLNVNGQERRIDVPDAAVRERTQEQLAEEHAVGAVVFGVLRLAGDLGDEIGRRIVLADKFVRHITRSSCARRRASTR